MVMFLAGHAHDGRDADRQRGHRDLGRSVDIHRVVFHVDEQPVVAARFADRRDIDGAREAQPHADRNFSGGELLLGVVRICTHVDTFRFVIWR